jgi:hypothetical protein
MSDYFMMTCVHITTRSGPEIYERSNELNAMQCNAMQVVLSCSRLFILFSLMCTIYQMQWMRYNAKSK